MGKSLVIVESPAKAKTINKYLGKDFKVLASMGHIRDLPTKKLGVEIDTEFHPNYVTLPSKKKIVAELRGAAKDADAVYLAPDPDREGEAICWHLQEAIVPKGKPVFRVLFNEITKKAIQEAIKKPGTVNMNLVDAQQARRILDRLVGYKISPILWGKIKAGISAGRVQSVALRMIVDREYEILAFVAEEFWSFSADLEGDSPPQLTSKLVKWDDQTLRMGIKAAKRTIANASEADEIEAILKKADFVVAEIKRKAKKQNPAPPFTTSKLQQDASRMLSFTVKKTMTLAQRLYEGKEIDGETSGLITYMRTDSTRVSDDAIQDVRTYIGEKFDERYLPENPRFYKQKKNAQDGHEAIRPTRVNLAPDDVAPYLDRDELRLYTLIWRRFVASQMAAKEMDETVLITQADAGTFETKGVVVTFPGFSAVFGEKSADDDSELPNVSVGEILKLLKLSKTQNFTKPPARYNEASLVKALEENGIGRPSTYASIIATIQNRTYVEKDQGKFVATELGLLVTDLLTNSFPELMDIHYTAKMEGLLDEVEQGTRTWQSLLSNFYGSFTEYLKQAEEHMPDIKRAGLKTDLICEECGKMMVIKNGKYGPFLSCSAYPDCTSAKRLRDLDASTTTVPVLKALISHVQVEQAPVDIECPECAGQLVRKKGKYGEFIACSNYPSCTYIHKEKVGMDCPRENCQGDIIVKKSKRGRVFYGCSAYPKCDFVSWDRPTGKPCPQCNEKTTYLKERKRGGNQISCASRDCGYKESAESLEAEAAVTE